MKKLIIGLTLMVLLLGTVACASPAAAPSPAPIPAPAPAPTPTPIPAPAPPGYDKGEGVLVPPVPPPVIAIPPAPAPAPSPGTVPTSPDLGESWATERMIVRTGHIELVVADVSSAIEQINGLAVSYEGYVVSSSSWREGDRLVGSIAIRVPAERFDDALRALRQMAVEVNLESTSSVDVTEEYIDLSARLHNLEASEEQLIRLLEKAGDVKDILEVQRELTQTRGEIEQTKGRMQYLEQTSETSFIDVLLQQAELDVNFTVNNRRVKVGQDVYFDPSIGGGISPYTYEWDFGDGSTSTDAVPTHAYKSEGSYNVILKVTDDRGNTDSQLRNNYIDVIPGWSAGGIASGAWNGLVTFGHGLSSFLIWLGIFSPVWIVIGAIIYFIYRWRRRRKKA